jgi:hypothetical protein
MLYACSRYVYRLFPPFCLGQSLLNIADLDLLNLLIFVGGTPRKPFDWDVSGTNSLYLACEVVAYYALTLVLDSLDQRGWSVRTTRCCTFCLSSSTRRHHSNIKRTANSTSSKSQSSADDIVGGLRAFGGEDEDVVAEAARVRSVASQGVDTIRMMGVRKEYVAPVSLPD